MWMWGDRFLNGEVSGIGQWEASIINTQAAIHAVPKDIVISDWHYDQAVPTAALFATEGFNVVSSPWRKSSVALAQLELIRSVRANASARDSRILGPTAWGDSWRTWSQCDTASEWRPAAISVSASLEWASTN